ncbi:hypothetical protein ACB092_08G107900 [Castanea dentata]
MEDQTQGSKVSLGGKRHGLGMTFYEPTVIGDVKSEMLLLRVSHMLRYLLGTCLWRRMPAGLIHPYVSASLFILISKFVLLIMADGWAGIATEMSEWFH